MAENQGVLVYLEHREGKLLPIALEGLGAGRRLADTLGQRLSCVAIGSNIAQLASQAIAAGADRVYLMDSPELADYQPDIYLALMGQLVAEARPQVIIMGHTDTGREIAPRLAFRFGTVAVTDCVELNIDNTSGRLLATKPVYGGNALAVFSTDTDPQVVTVRTKAMAPAVPNASRQGEVITPAYKVEPSVVRARIVRRVLAESAGVKLEDAAVVVAGGRGIGGAEGFKQLEDLARLLKGAIGASRPPCDSGWISDTAQVGLTGKIIAPELYIAVAISGSSQHMSGCSGARTIVAINKDREANIFRHARFGVVGDWKKVLPAFTAKVKELLAS
ncbi:MAG: electron transfer flavoprotein subunit alpha/FixB family protein [Dehalococcoidales bacterium]|nr:electron transfer flavoprotein subunit alpha/FixB family protein [Dehalococcoidales bacterium]